MTDRLLRAALLLALTFLVVACQSGTRDADELPPTIRITGPLSSTQQFLGEAFTLTGEAADETELAGVEVQAGSADPVAATVDDDGNWSVEITPSAVGPLHVTATASDAAGNTAEAIITYEAFHRGASYLVLARGFYAGSDSGAVVQIHPTSGGSPDYTQRPDSAIVLVNGTKLDPAPGQPTLGFQGKLATPLAEGDTVSLEIDIDGVIITASVIVPHIPTITSPGDGDSLPAGAPLTVAWDVAPDPDYFQALLLGADPYTVWSDRVEGTERTVVLDLGGVDTSGATLQLQVVASNENDVSAFTGPVSAGSTITAEGRTPFEGWPNFTIGSAAP